MDEDYNYDNHNFTYGYIATSGTFYHGEMVMHDYRYGDNIRISVFLIAGLCSGLPALIWAVRSLYQLQGVRVSVFIACLLFSDALELLLTPFILAYRFKQEFFIERLYFIPGMFHAVRLCGLCLHQLVALEGILSLRNPVCSSRLSSPLVSMPIVISLVICASTTFFSFIEMGLHVLTCIVAVITCVLAYKASRSLLYTDMNPVYYVTVIAMVTLAFLYGPHIVCMWISVALFVGFPSPPAFAVYVELWTMSHSIVCMHLIADSLLCVLICRKIPWRIFHNLARDQQTDSLTIK